MSKVPNQKDYIALYVLDYIEHGRLADILNRNGAPNLTVCPTCRVDDFVHVEGCRVAALCDKATKSI